MSRIQVKNKKNGSEANESPHLIITEQPQTHYKFRYITEMESSHGCVYGKSYDRNKKEKTFPEVELLNYDGRATISCTLVEVDSSRPHPHSLHSSTKDHEFSAQVPEEGSYKVRFPGLCIVHTGKQEVKKWVRRQHDTTGMNEKEIKELDKKCAVEAKQINLNVLRLMFIAYDCDGEPLCDPVFSDPINNLKSAATNILKICRLSKHNSRARGREDIIMLVEKVLKKNIKIRFFEMSEDGEQVWEAFGEFMENEVHHQYAISFRTPPYSDVKIRKKVTVYVELVRPSDGQTSEPKEFHYMPEPILMAASKKRKMCDNFETPPWTPNNNAVACGSNDTVVIHNEKILENQLLQLNAPYNFADYYPQAENIPSSSKVLYVDASVPMETVEISDVFPHTAVTNNLTFSSTAVQFTNELIQNLNLNEPVTPVTSMGKIDTVNIDNIKDLFSLEDLFSDDILNSVENETIPLSSDSGGAGSLQTTSPKRGHNVRDSGSAVDDAVMGQMVKSLKDFIKIISSKSGNPDSKPKMIQALKELFKLQLSNGDNFLHMALSTKQPLLNYIVHTIHSSDLEYMLNMRNHQQQTILHLAVVNDMPEMIKFLISKGCDPMLEDVEGNNVIHYTVMCQTNLGPLMEAMKDNHIVYNLDAFNHEKQTALHLTVIYKDAANAEILLKEGASYKVLDNEGRSPLHLAAYDDCLSVAQVLLASVKLEEVDEEDTRGYNALQIVCNGQLKENTLEMVRLLLEYKADPLREGKFKSALSLVKHKPKIRKIFEEFLHLPSNDGDTDSSEEFESADDASDTDIWNEDEEVAKSQSLEPHSA